MTFRTSSVCGESPSLPGTFSMDADCYDQGIWCHVNLGTDFCSIGTGLCASLTGAAFFSSKSIPLGPSFAGPDSTFEEIGSIEGERMSFAW